MNADYMPEPQTTADKAAAYRLAARARRSSVATDAMPSRRGPNDAYYDAAAVLRFESEHPMSGGNKESQIRQAFNCSAARYQQRLYHLIHEDQDSSMLIDAQTVNRLLRLEAERAEARRRRFQGGSE